MPCNKPAITVPLYCDHFPLTTSSPMLSAMHKCCRQQNSNLALTFSFSFKDFNHPMTQHISPAWQGFAFLVQHGYLLEGVSLIDDMIYGINTLPPRSIQFHKPTSYSFYSTMKTPHYLGIQML